MVRYVSRPDSNAVQRPLRLLQLTDTHVSTDPAARLYGADWRAGLDAVLADIQSKDRAVDRVLLTGDLVHDEGEQAYRILADFLEPAGWPRTYICGNHDDPAAIRVLGAQAHDPPDSAWQILRLESRIPGSAGGRLGPAQIEELDARLADDRKHALVCVHHQPVPVGSAWLDRIGLSDGPELLAMLARHPQVRGVVWGHVHQAFDGRHGEIALMGTPSTCVQFLPGSDDFAIDTRPPGYRELDLWPDGRIQTRVCWVEAVGKDRT